MATSIISENVLEHIEFWREAFAKHWSFLEKNPDLISSAKDFLDYTAPGWELMNREPYRRDYTHVPNPLSAVWYTCLVCAATRADLDALEAAFQTPCYEDPTGRFSQAYLRYLLLDFLRQTHQADQAGKEVHPSVPAWLRERGLPVDPSWNCEPSAPPPAPPPPNALSLPGPPPRVAWRQGSCGESGPFIGLSYARSILLVKRMQEQPDVCPFELLHALEEELDDADAEPNPRRDFTIAEVIRGMAVSYGWDADRTRIWLDSLRM